MPNFINLIQQHADHSPGAVACRFLANGEDESACITYAELDTQARAIAATLQGRMAVSGRVLLLYPAGLDFVAAFLGCLYAGVVAVPLAVPVTVDIGTLRSQIELLAGDADISGVLSENAFAGVAEACLADAVTAGKIVILNTTGSMDSPGTYSAPDLRQEALAFLQYTSGSVSSPKGVMVTHRQLSCSLETTGKAWRYGSDSITLCWAPHAHIYGLVCGILLPLQYGSQAILMPTAAVIQQPLRWLRGISRYQVTHSGCPNFGYDLCLQDIPDTASAEIDLASWAVAVNGGECVQPDTLAQFRKKFRPFGFRPGSCCPAYGMSEMVGAITSNPCGRLPRILRLDPDVLVEGKAILRRKNKPFRSCISNGHLLDGLKMAVVDTEGRRLGEGKVGEVWLSGTTMASGYWNRPAETEAVFKATLAGESGYWLRTGDLGFIRDGELYLTGRLKDMIVLYGKKYYAGDIEKTVMQAFAGQQTGHGCAAFAVMTDGREGLVFLLEIKSGASVQAQDAIITTVRDTLWKAYRLEPYAVILVADQTLPKTPSGKLQRSRCKEQFEQQQLNILRQVSQHADKSPSCREPCDTESPSVRSGAAEIFLAMVAKVTGYSGPLRLDAPVSQYGFDSLSIIRLTASVNQHFHLNLTPDILYSHSTLASFYNTYIQPLSTPNNPSAQSHPKENDHNSAIAVIGMSSIFPGASDPLAFWDNLVQGKDVIRPVPPERLGGGQQNQNSAAWPDDAMQRVRWAGLLENLSGFDARFFGISPREAELMDPQQRLFLQVAWNAIEDAGYAASKLAARKTGLFVGIFSDGYAGLLHRSGVTDAFITTGVTRSMLANRVSYLLDLHGPSETIDTACSSSLVAVHHAVRALQQGDCELALVGGVNALLDPEAWVAAGRAGMLSPGGRCRTFDQQADGYVRGEGIAAILLKPLNRALEDGDSLHGILLGSAVNHGGHVSSLTVPNPQAQADVVVAACQRAGIPVNSLSYIETHGTGTPLGDPIEINGLKQAFTTLSASEATSLQKYFCGLGSVKTHIGHLESAAGLAGLIKVLLSMQHGLMPGNLHFDSLNPYIDLEDSPFFIVQKNMPWVRPQDAAGHTLRRRAGVSSFGFGGTNAHVIVEEAPPSSVSLPPVFPLVPYLVTVSAKTRSALKQRVQGLLHWLRRQTETVSLPALSYTLNTGREHFSERFAVVVDAISGLQERWETFLQTGPPPDNGPGASADFSTITGALQGNMNALSADAYRCLLTAVTRLYSTGQTMDLSLLRYDDRRRLFLPGYPFEPAHYWLPVPDAASSISAESSDQNTPVELVTAVQNDFVQQVAQLLKISPDTVSVTASLSDLGFNSILFSEFAVDLEEHFGLPVSPAIFFTHGPDSTIQAISQQLCDEYAPAIMKKFPAASRVSYPAQTTVTPAPAVERRQTNKAVLAVSPIAIVGMQGLFPQSRTVQALWEHLYHQHDLVTEVPASRWRWQDCYGDAKKDPTKSSSKWGGFLEDVDLFDAGFFNISAHEASLMDPQQRLMLETAWHAIEDAGINPQSLSGQPVGVFISVEFNDYQNLMVQQGRIFHGHVATGTSPGLLANRISYFLDLHGPSEVIQTACSGSLVAIHRAVTALQQGECRLALAGGVSLMLNPDIFVITSQLGALSPEGRCRTFDQSANGYVKGEGVAALLLKPLAAALQDGDNVYAVIRSSAVNHGGKSQSLTAPNAKAQSEVLVDAWRRADISPYTLSYMEVHGTGTALGDPVEMEGIKLAFRTMAAEPPAEARCGLGSIKTNTGHLEPASGIAGVIKVVLSLQHGVIPGNLHFESLNSYIDFSGTPFYVADKTIPWQRLQDSGGHELPRRAGVSSFGFGGTNAHVVLEEALDKMTAVEHDQPSQGYGLFTLSAKSKAALRKKIADLGRWLTDYAKTTSADALSYTLNVGRTHFDYRCAVVAASLQELCTTLESLEAGQHPSHVCMNEEALPPLYGPVLGEVYQSSLRKIREGLSTGVAASRETWLLLADLYTRRYSIDWEVLHAGTDRRRLAGLPGYPFEGQRYWFNTVMTLPAASVPPIPAQEKPDAQRDTETIILDYLKGIFSEKLGNSAQHMTAQATYEVYGVDSMLGLEIITRLEKDFGTLSRTLLYERNTLQTLSRYLIERYPRQSAALAGDPEGTEAAGIAATLPVSIQPVREEIRSAPMKTEESIAIIGISAIFPGSPSLDALWVNLREGRNCIAEVPADRWNWREWPVNIGGEKKYFRFGGFIPDIDRFDPLFFNIAPRDAVFMDPQERLFLQSAWEALENAGLSRESLHRTVANRVGVFVGVTYNFYPLFIAEEWAKGNRLPLDIQQFSIANRVSYFLGLEGPSLVVDTACSSSLAAIHLACESLLRGECQTAIAGGVNLSLHPAKYHFLGSLGFMSEQGRCASFAAGGKGYVPAEGVGTVLLKPLSLALRDGDRIDAVIRASAMNHGGKTSGYTVPNPNAQASLIREALGKAGINPRSLSYIEAHGTGTALGDPIEIRGLQEAFETFTRDRQFCAIGSVKSNLGHTESAAGMSQLSKVVLQMKYKKLVPSIHSEVLNPYIDFSTTPFYVQTQVSDWITQKGVPRRAGISSFGAGGTNVHLIVEEYVREARPSVSLTRNPPLFFVLSAMNSERLRDYVKKFMAWFQEAPHTDGEDVRSSGGLQALCYTLQVGREPLQARLLIQVASFDGLVQKLAAWLQEGQQYQEDWTGDHVSYAQDWMAGRAVAWDALWSEKPPRIPLPTYPFEKRRCWVGSAVPVPQDVPPVPMMTAAEVEIPVTDLPEGESIAVLQASEAGREKVIPVLLTLLAELLGLASQEIETGVPFQNYGLDSINGIHFVSALGKHYPDLVTPMDLYRYPSIDQLAEYIAGSGRLLSADEPTAHEDSMTSILDENQFMTEIAHLSHADVAKLMEDELLALDTILST